MKFKCNSSYIPNLTSAKTEYRIINQETGMLNYILEDTCKILNELFYQYPNCLEEEKIKELIEYQYKTAQLLGVDPNCCYHYNWRTKGIIIRESIEQESFPMKLTITELKQGIPIYQRRIELIYDMESDSFIPTDLIEIEKHDGILIQTNSNPNILKKKRKYINY